MAEIYFLEDPAREMQAWDEIADKHRKHAVMMGGVTPEMAQRFSNIARAYPHMTPGVVEALSRDGFDWDSGETVTSAKAEADRLAQRPVIERAAEKVWTGVKGVARGVFAAADVAVDDGVGRLVSSVARGSDEASDDEGEFFNPAGFASGFAKGLTAPARSSGLQALGQLSESRDMLDQNGRVIGQRPGISLGEGFLPGGRAAMDADRERYDYRIAGVPATFGHLTTATLMTPGSQRQQKMASLVDMAFDIASDPVNLVAPLGAASRARRTFGEAVDLTSGFAVRSKAVTAPLRKAGAGRVADRLEKGLAPATRVRYAPRQVGQVASGEAAVKYGLLAGPTGGDIAPDLVVNSFLANDRQGRELVAALTGNASARDIWLRTKKAFTPSEARKLADAATEQETVEALKGILGIRVREKPKVGGIGIADRTFETSRLPGVKRDLHGVRIFKDVPDRMVSLTDPDSAAEVLDDFLANAKVPDEAREARFSEMTQAQFPEDIREVVMRAAKDVDEGLRERGVKAHVARDLTKMYDDFLVDAREYAVDGFGRRMGVPGSEQLTIGGQVEQMPSMHLLSEAADQVMPLPDPRAIRQQASAIGFLWEDETVRKLALDGITNGTAWFMSNVWKPAQLLRGAWTVRVVGEEQVRLAAMGMTSMVSNPFSHIAWVTGAKFDVLGGATDLAHMRSSGEEFVAAMSRGDAGFVRDTPRQFANGDWIIQKRQRGPDGEWVTPEGFHRGWAAEVGQLTGDEVARRVATGLRKDEFVGGLDSLDQVKEWFWHGGGRVYRERLARSRSRNGLMTDRALADSYIDSVNARLHIKTGGRVSWEEVAPGRFAYRIESPGDRELIDGIGTGHLRGTNLATAGPDELPKLLRDHFDHLEVAAVKSPRMMSARQQGFVDKLVEHLFQSLMSNPTNKLSRSPAFRQFYWQRLTELAPWMDDTTLAAAKKGARAAKVPDEVLRRLDDVTATAGKITDLKAADEVAKAFGLDQTRKLLYDLSKRNQFFDIHRNIFPFGEAWKEILGTWAKLGVRNPALAEGARQGVEGLRESGTFYTNQYGDEVFGFPMLWWAGGWLAGGDGPVEGKLTLGANQVNLLSQSVIPGFGPVVQVPASFLLKGMKWDNVKKLISPYDTGRDEDAGIAGAILDPMFPAWGRRMFAAFTEGGGDARVFGNAVIDVGRAQMANGKLTPQDLKSDDTMERLRADAQWLYLIRGVMQFAGPAGPMMDWQYKDKTGRIFSAVAAADVYYELEKSLDGDSFKAAAEFEKRFGFEPWDVVTAKSSQVNIRALDPTGVRWEEDHPELVDALKSTIGLFAPQGDDRFSGAAYVRQIMDGDRDVVSPESWRWLRNDTAGRAAFKVVLDKTEDMKDRDERTRVRDSAYYKLQELYPGFGESERAAVATPVSVEDRIREMEAAYADPELRAKLLEASPAGEVVGDWLDLRAAAIAKAEAAGIPPKRWASRQATQQLREAMIQIGDQWADEFPEFRAPWERVLRREIDKDEE